MSTTPVESWAVDLNTLGPVYPFVGLETVLVIAAVIFWIGWHVIQLSMESRTYEEDLRLLEDPEVFERTYAKSERER
ncbi:MAG: hypothetical protein Kilf2KO_32250 [Rhodospirillales bacterium]